MLNIQTSKIWISSVRISKHVHILKQSRYRVSGYRSSSNTECLDIKSLVVHALMCGHFFVRILKQSGYWVSGFQGIWISLVNVNHPFWCFNIRKIGNQGETVVSLFILSGGWNFVKNSLRDVWQPFYKMKRINAFLLVCHNMPFFLDRIHQTPPTFWWKE